MGINNILKHFNSFSQRIEAGYYKHNNSSYNTNYDLVDHKGKIIHSDRRMTCFTTITSSTRYHTGEFIQFGVGQKLYVYALSQDTILSESEIKRYINYIKKLGLSFKFHIKEDYDLSYMRFLRRNLDVQYDDAGNRIYPEVSEKADVFEKGLCSKYDCNSDTVDNINDQIIEYDTSKPLLCFKRQKVYILEIDLNIHKTMASVKLLLYLFRYIYEFDFDICVKKALDYKSKYPQYDFMNILHLMNHHIRNYKRCTKYNKIYSSSNYRTGHNLFTNIYPHLNTKSLKENLKIAIDKELKKGYFDTSIYDIVNFKHLKIKVETNYGSSSITVYKFTLNDNISIDEFYKFIYKQKDTSKLIPNTYKIISIDISN